MEKRSEISANPCAGFGSRFSDFNKSFKFALRSLLTSCSKEEFYKAFSSFSNTEKELLHRLYLQVITSLHENIEDEFESICLRTQVGAALDDVEEIVEERELDLLSSNRSNMMDVAENLSTAKKNEIQHLMHMVQSGEEHNRMIRKRLQVLKESRQALSGSSRAVEEVEVYLNWQKFSSINFNYGASRGDV